MGGSLLATRARKRGGSFSRPPVCGHDPSLHMKLKELMWAVAVILGSAPWPVRFIFWLGVGAAIGEFFVDRLDRLLARIRRFGR